MSTKCNHNQSYKPTKFYTKAHTLFAIVKKPFFLAGILYIYIYIYIYIAVAHKW